MKQKKKYIYKILYYVLTFLLFVYLKKSYVYFALAFIAQTLIGTRPGLNRYLQVDDEELEGAGLDAVKKKSPSSIPLQIKNIIKKMHEKKVEA